MCPLQRWWYKVRMVALGFIPMLYAVKCFDLLTFARKTCLLSAAVCKIKNNLWRHWRGSCESRPAGEHLIDKITYAASPSLFHIDIVESFAELLLLAFQPITFFFFALLLPPSSHRQGLYGFGDKRDLLFLPLSFLYLMLCCHFLLFLPHFTLCPSFDHRVLQLPSPHSFSPPIHFSSTRPFIPILPPRSSCFASIPSVHLGYSSSFLPLGLSPPHTSKTSFFFPDKFLPLLCLQPPLVYLPILVFCLEDR